MKKQNITTISFIPLYQELWLLQEDKNKLNNIRIELRKISTVRQKRVREECAQYWCHDWTTRRVLVSPTIIKQESPSVAILEKNIFEQKCCHFAFAFSIGWSKLSKKENGLNVMFLVVGIWWTNGWGKKKFSKKSKISNNKKTQKRS